MNDGVSPLHGVEYPVVIAARQIFHRHLGAQLANRRGQFLDSATFDRLLNARNNTLVLI